MKTRVDRSEATLQCYVQSIAILGPGLANWNDALSILSGKQNFCKSAFDIPPVTWLPAAERRRVGKMVRLALTVGKAAIQDAGMDARDLATVFTSSSGDGDNCDAIFQTLAHPESSERFISPTRFHNSVHNAPAGYWSIANQCTLPSTSLCAYDASFSAGLLEACCQVRSSGKSILLISSDVMYPYPLSGIRPMDSDFAVAMILSLSANNTTQAKLTLNCTSQPMSRMDTPELEALRSSNPSARSLPLLQVLADKIETRGHDFSSMVYLEYLEPLSLEVRID